MPRNILIASLGDSPVVVTSMYDRLTKIEGLTFDEVVVLYPQGTQDACELVCEAFSELIKEAKLTTRKLCFEDADSWEHTLIFLQALYQLLADYQCANDKVCLSLAGGRKSMAALMAWIVPFFSCIEKLYHILDPDEESFYPMDTFDKMSSERPMEHLRLSCAKLKELTLVGIPFERGLQLDMEERSFLKSALPPKLVHKEYDLIEEDMVRQAIQRGKILSVWVTERVKEQFESYCKASDWKLAKQVRYTFECMRYLSRFQDSASEEVIAYKSKDYKPGKLPIYYFEDDEKMSVFPVFYTLNKDFRVASEDQVDKVVICDLVEAENRDTKPSLKEVVSAPEFSIHPSVKLDKLAYVPHEDPAASILIVPLGEAPMVATQLYTLLKEREKRVIREVVLLYPGQAAVIANGAEIIKKALQEEDCTPCHCLGIPGLRDITSKADCKLYQEWLERVIKAMRGRFPDYKIDLALSGGRKGMTAMTIFAARKMGLQYVYHTVIADKELSEKVEMETAGKRMKGQIPISERSMKERRDRLFLRKYRDDYSQFKLFRVPVTFRPSRQEQDC
ncbi:hypothetical protein EPA93_22800 [Ktedonosporobacter rubrisoli]|uniref:CRISPR system ring nuclease SSO2081-like domain-containing protein n=1 Tax=Ktedonosporobacter rubrisoli TaxID=2509675 RepID=A0A4V0YZ67_KTERU|nr:CRISPR-associated ring nuclease [Ktedonosporobacter rubrisoli]QBD78661.1 hypothetical protein EPA93_22800 [Ktedonosporobacter rubrisoli]